MQARLWTLKELWKQFLWGFRTITTVTLLVPRRTTVPQFLVAHGVHLSLPHQILLYMSPQASTIASMATMTKLALFWLPMWRPDLCLIVQNVLMRFWCSEKTVDIRSFDAHVDIYQIAEAFHLVPGSIIINNEFYQWDQFSGLTLDAVRDYDLSRPFEVKGTGRGMFNELLELFLLSCILPQKDKYLNISWLIF